MASMKSFQAMRSPAIPLTSFHDLSVFLISSSVVLRHVLFGLLLLLYPWGFQSFSIAPTSLRNVCPIQFHFLLFIWISIGFCLVILHSPSFVILSVYIYIYVCIYIYICIYICISYIFIIRLKHFLPLQQHSLLTHGITFPPEHVLTWICLTRGYYI
jgi:hypothetical protein